MIGAIALLVMLALALVAGVGVAVCLIGFTGVVMRLMK